MLILISVPIIALCLSFIGHFIACKFIMNTYNNQLQQTCKPIVFGGF